MCLAIPALITVRIMGLIRPVQTYAIFERPDLTSSVVASP
jgi:hypothetical protein